VELAHGDARALGIRTGDEVGVASNGASRTLRARVNRRLLAGVVRIADEHAAGLGDTVLVTSAQS
jgi:anaerobic selenocysteine-containing dehydrogenase